MCRLWQWWESVPQNMQQYVKNWVKSSPNHISRWVTEYATVCEELSQILSKPHLMVSFSDRICNSMWRTESNPLQTSSHGEFLWQNIQRSVKNWVKSSPNLISWWVSLTEYATVCEELSQILSKPHLTVSYRQNIQRSVNNWVKSSPNHISRWVTDRICNKCSVIKIYSIRQLQRVLRDTKQKSTEVW